MFHRQNNLDLSQNQIGPQKFSFGKENAFLFFFAFERAEFYIKPPAIFFIEHRDCFSPRRCILHESKGPFMWYCMSSVAIQVLFIEPYLKKPHMKILLCSFVD